MPDSKYAKYIVTELKTDRFTPDAIAQYATWAKRILWLDNKVVEGAFQMNVSWYLKPNASSEMSDPHVHDYDEVIAFFGSNPDDPYDLGGEVEFWLEDEKFLLTRSCLIFAPKGLRHCPLIIRRVDRPIFHFSIVTGGQYEYKKE